MNDFVRFEMVDVHNDAKSKANVTYIDDEKTPLTSENVFEPETKGKKSVFYGEEYVPNSDGYILPDPDSRHASSYLTENTDSLTGALDNRVSHSLKFYECFH